MFSHIYHSYFAVKGPLELKSYLKTLHLLIVLNTSRQILTDSCCHLKILPLPLAMRHKLIAWQTREKRQLNVARQLQNTMAKWIPHLTCSKGTPLKSRSFRGVHTWFTQTGQIYFQHGNIISYLSNSQLQVSLTSLNLDPTDLLKTVRKGLLLSEA